MEFETLKQIEEYEATNVLSDEQRRVLFERQMQIFLGIHQWLLENEWLGLAHDLTDTGRPNNASGFYAIGKTPNFLIRLTTARNERMMK